MLFGRKAEQEGGQRIEFDQRGTAIAIVTQPCGHRTCWAHVTEGWSVN